MIYDIVSGSYFDQTENNLTVIRILTKKKAQ